MDGAIENIDNRESFATIIPMKDYCLSLTCNIIDTFMQNT